MAIDLRNIGAIYPNANGSITVPANVDITGTPAPEYMINGVPIGGAAGANGNVQYNNNGSFAGSANLFWDNTNARLGIGTAAPQAALDVAGNARVANPGAPDPYVALAVGGNVVVTQYSGVDTTEGLHLFYANSIGRIYSGPSPNKGPFVIEAASPSGVPGISLGFMTDIPYPIAGGHLVINPGLYTYNAWLDFCAISGGSVYNSMGGITFSSTSLSAADKRIVKIEVTDEGPNTDSGSLSFSTALAGAMGERMRIDSMGRVGIGTATPQAALDVAGTPVTGITPGDITRLVSTGTYGYLDVESNAESGIILRTAAGAFQPRIYANSGLGGWLGIGLTGNSGSQGDLCIISSNGQISWNKPATVPVGATFFTLVTGADYIDLNLRATGAASVSEIKFNTDNPVYWVAGSRNNSDIMGTFDGAFVIANQSVSGPLAAITILKDGAVGVGTTTPQAALDVTGTSSATVNMLDLGDVYGQRLKFNPNLIRADVFSPNSFTISSNQPVQIESDMDVTLNPAGYVRLQAQLYDVVIQPGPGRSTIFTNGGIYMPGLPNSPQGLGSLWYDPADGNRVKFSP